MSAAIDALGDSIYGGGCPYDFHAGLILMIKGYGGDIMEKLGDDDYRCVINSPETLEAVTL